MREAQRDREKKNNKIKYNAKALLELEACRAGGPCSWGRSTVGALLVSIWSPFERAASLAAAPPTPGRQRLFAWEKMSLVSCPSRLSNFKAQQEDVL